MMNDEGHRSPLMGTNYNKKLAKCIKQINYLSLHMQLMRERISIIRIHVHCPVIIALFHEICQDGYKTKIHRLYWGYLFSTPHYNIGP